MVRFGDSVVLVTACRAANPREGIDFLPLTVDYREYTYASGRIPGGFFKREGKPAEKEVLTSRVHRSADPAALPLRLALRDADHRAGPVRRSGERHRRPRDYRRLRGARALRDSVREDDRRRPRRSRRRPVRHQSRPSSSAKRASSTSSSPARKDGLVMVEAGAKEVTEEQVVAGARNRACRHQADRRRDRRSGARGRQEEAGRREEGNRPRLLPRGRGESATCR